MADNRKSQDEREINRSRNPPMNPEIMVKRIVRGAHEFCDIAFDILSKTEPSSNADVCRIQKVVQALEEASYTRWYRYGRSDEILEKKMGKLFAVGIRLIRGDSSILPYHKGDCLKWENLDSYLQGRKI